MNQIEELRKRRKKLRTVMILFFVSLSIFISICITYIILNNSPDNDDIIMFNDTNYKGIKSKEGLIIQNIFNDKDEEIFNLYNKIVVNDKEETIYKLGTEKEMLGISNIKYLYINEYVDFSKHTIIKCDNYLNKIIYLDFDNYELFKNNNENNMVGINNQNYKNINIIGYYKNNDNDEVIENMVSFFKYANVIYHDIDDNIYYIDYYDNEIIEQRIKDPSRSGYIFKGWYKDKELTEEWDFDNDIVNTYLRDGINEYYKINKIIHLYAKWEEE